MGMTRTIWLLCFVVSSSCDLGLPPAIDVTRLESADPSCHADLEALREGLDTGQLWAQTMVDASVKSPVGVLSQTAVQFGDFDECLTISTPVTSQYCLVDISPFQAGNTSFNSVKWTSLKWGICVPASCTVSGLQTSLQSYMDNETAPDKGITVGIIPEACTTNKTSSKDITLADVTFCVVMAIMVLAVFLATVYDLRQRPDYDGVSPPQTISQCLSLRQGYCSLMRRDRPVPGINLNVLYGLHSCAFVFILMGHRFGAHFAFMQVTNYKSVEHVFVDSWFSIWMGHMELFVDIFFFMSAFLLSLFYYAELHKRFISPFMVYLFRLCRIVPAYVVVIFFYATLFRQLGDGPLWNIFMDGEQNACRNSWWTNLLFINNYVDTGNICLIQTWYISCDFQLFVFGTILILVLHKSPLSGAVLTAVLFIVSTLTLFLGTYLYDRPAILLFTKDFWTDVRHHDVFTTVYMQGHYRGTSYLPGLLAGCYVFKHRNNPLSQNQTYALQIPGILCCLLLFWTGCLFYVPSGSQNHLVAALYAAFYHTIFGIGMALIIVSCTLGQSTFITQLLSWEGFVPLSKLSFCVYLVHNFTQYVWLASSRTAVYLTPLELVSWTISDIALSLVIAFFLCLTVETPARYLIKFLMTGSPPVKSVPQVDETLEKYTIQDTFDFQKRIDSPFQS